MKKLLLALVLVLFVAFPSYSATYGRVVDTNNGNNGDILVSTGENKGKKSIGTWTDPSFLKGEKGDRGKRGKQGNEGAQGQRGEQGKGLNDPLELQYEGVIKSWKRVDLSTYYIHDFKNNINTVGVKVKHYWGKSWAERELEKVNNRLEALEKTPINYVARDNIKVVETSNGFKIEKIY